MKSPIKVYYGATGKMVGTSHISVASGQPETCHRCNMSKECYAKRYQKIYPAIEKSYFGNGLKLIERIYSMGELPVISSRHCRFDAFGEIFDGDNGTIQLTNYTNIARKNNEVIFVLWSRNYKKVEEFFTNNEKPDNLKIVRSTASIDKPYTHIPNIHIWDGVFNVVTKEYASKYNIKTNCGMYDEHGDKIPCISCSTGCYHKGKKVIAFEYVK